MPHPGVGVPIKLLHEAEGQIITAEMTTGETYRGHLQGTEDSMNLRLVNVTMTARDGSHHKLQHVYLRGGNVRFIVMPDMLKHSPMFRNCDPKQPKIVGLGRGNHMPGNR
ncbi:MAG: hypothetical protein MHM6MM_002062 [Cercozoa sp. M6MM]